MKGQVTIFIVLGLVLLLAVGAMIYLVGIPVINPQAQVRELDNAQAMQCLDRSVEAAIGALETDFFIDENEGLSEEAPRLITEAAQIITPKGETDIARISLCEQNGLQGTNAIHPRDRCRPDVWGVNSSQHQLEQAIRNNFKNCMNLERAIPARVEIQAEHIFVEIETGAEDNVSVQAQTSFKLDLTSIYRALNAYTSMHFGPETDVQSTYPQATFTFPGRGNPVEITRQQTDAPDDDKLLFSSQGRTFRINASEIPTGYIKENSATGLEEVLYPDVLLPQDYVYLSDSFPVNYLNHDNLDSTPPQYNNWITLTQTITSYDGDRFQLDGSTSSTYVEDIQIQGGPRIYAIRLKPKVTCDWEGQSDKTQTIRIPQLKQGTDVILEQKTITLRLSCPDQTPPGGASP